MAVTHDVHPRAEGRDLAAAAFRKQGIAAGLFGAFLLAVWFLYLDLVRGEPLFTPTLLAQALFGGVPPDAVSSLEGSIPMTLLFTAIHGIVFGLIGLGAAELLLRLTQVRSRALILLLVFGVLCVGFFAFAVNVHAVGPEAVAVRDALIGNAIAAFGMTAYLARNLPRARPA